MADTQKTNNLRNWITKDGSSGFKAEPGRYHLYVALSCPFAHRALILRKVKGLENVVGVTVVDYLKDEKGWRFTNDKPKCQLDEINGCHYLSEIYNLAIPGYNGKVSVPVLWDKREKTIVNNESAEIIQMLNSEFNEFCSNAEQAHLNLYPNTTDVRKEIDEINDLVADGINIGVYKAGFATDQATYEVACRKLFETLDKMESILSKNRFLTGDKLTMADVRLFTSLVRFDLVYHGLFKCNLKRLIDYPNVWNFVRDVYNMYGIADTVDREHIVKSYYMSMKNLNPTGIYPLGPELDFSIPAERRQKFGVK